MKANYLIIIALIFIAFSCKKDDESAIPAPAPDQPVEQMYFPPVAGNEWDTMSFATAGWDTTALTALYDFLETNETRAFIVLQNGKIVTEKYWGNNIIGNAAFTADSKWYWASAGKTLTAMITGIAQQEGLLDINDKTSTYLGNGWTNMPQEKEDLILIKNQLTMTSGLDYFFGSIDCTDSECLQYKTDAGTEWYYYNAPYTLLESVVGNASGLSYNAYCDQSIENKVGMSGSWISQEYNNVYWSTARDAARFGLLLLNKGVWDTDSVLNDIAYFTAMTNSSQDLNPSYGYLTWLNGKESIILPSLPLSFNTSLSPNAPEDLFAALGKNGQFVNVIPSKNMVVIRMGTVPDNGAVPLIFHDEMWEKINAVIGI
ncbi:serine hydrolase [Cryomorpha ignava]|uniref:Serine hydrolase n=1 Tax=Cryomorpha ignava TaxID=101383 RepID=A0A7K3WVZ0_9FLAO|nr:serine hydrolase [Cryomorpha ignava]NEN24765.1 serine hydrolase [Cryomorpha ignava]